MARIREVTAGGSRARINEHSDLAADANRLINRVNNDYCQREYRDRSDNAGARRIIRDFSVVVSRNNRIRSRINYNSIIQAYRRLESSFRTLERTARRR